MKNLGTSVGCDGRKAPKEFVDGMVLMERIGNLESMNYKGVDGFVVVGDG